MLADVTGNYPPGTWDADPRAPWNPPDPWDGRTCSECAFFARLDGSGVCAQEPMEGAGHELHRAGGRDAACEAFME